VWLLDQTAVFVETSTSFADFGEHHSRAENGASGTENCESRKKMAVRAFSTVVVSSGFSGVLVVLFQSHFLLSVLAKFLAKTCYKFMTFWQNRAKFTTALSWVLVIFASTRKQICSPLLLFQRVGGSSKSHICLWHSLSSLSCFTI
jgi:hypothetical protein